MIDLDARRAEAHHEELVVRFGGKEWVIPAELPILVPEHLSRGDMVAAVEVLFGEDAEAVLAVRPPLSLEDVKAIAEGYSVTLGEASASSDS